MGGVFNVVLYEPEIPGNTGNIVRLCANTGTALHLIKPLGFEWSDRRLKRAGLDYHEWASVRLHETLHDCLLTLPHSNLYAFSTKGRTTYSQASFRNGDTLLFGPETRGLPGEVLNNLADANVLRMPMQETSRSLNLSNTVAIAVYEAWRQLEFPGGR